MNTATVSRKLGRSLTPALTAHVQPAQLRRIFAGVRFEELGDYEAPEPSLSAAVELGSGVVAVVSWGKLSHELLVDLPRGASVPSFLREVRIPAETITWSRSGRVAVKGDNLSKIAKHQVGDANAWRRIYEANKQVIGDDPDKIKPGQKLRIRKQVGGGPKLA